MGSCSLTKVLYLIIIANQEDYFVCPALDHVFIFICDEVISNRVSDFPGETVLFITDGGALCEFMIRIKFLAVGKFCFTKIHIQICKIRSYNFNREVQNLLRLWNASPAGFTSSHVYI